MTDMKSLIGGFVVLIVGLALTPTVAEFAADAKTNLTGSSATLIGLVPFFWVLVIIAATVGLVVYAIKSGSK